MSDTRNHLPSCLIKYAELTDSEVVLRGQRGDNQAAEYLLYKYRNLVRTRIRTYFLMGADKDDLTQIGMIGLWQAIQDYRADRQISFSSFAKVCIQRHIITAIKTATRQKQIPLNNAVSLHSTSDSAPDEYSLSDLLVSTESRNPEELIVEKEDTFELHRTLLSLLSEFEWSVLVGYQVGKSYREIANEMHCNTKSVDNALVRVKRKVSEINLGMANLSQVLLNSGLPTDRRSL